MPETFCGIDVGKTGAMAFVHSSKQPPSVFPFAKHSIYNLARVLTNFKPTIICLENPPGYMPGNGKKSIKGLFMNYGTWVGMLETLGLEYINVSPQKWQNKLNCRTGGDKRITHRFAQELFPQMTITHAIADSLLIAHYARLVYA